MASVFSVVVALLAVAAVCAKAELFLDQNATSFTLGTRNLPQSRMWQVICGHTNTHAHAHACTCMHHTHHFFPTPSLTTIVLHSSLFWIAGGNRRICGCWRHHSLPTSTGHSSHCARPSQQHRRAYSLGQRSLCHLCFSSIAPKCHHNMRIRHVLAEGVPWLGVLHSLFHCHRHCQHCILVCSRGACSFLSKCPRPHWCCSANLGQHWPLISSCVSHLSCKGSVCMHVTHAYQ